MNRGMKACGIVVSVILLSVLLPIIIMTSPYLDNPFTWGRWRFIERSLLNYYFQQYLFWISLAFAILLLIAILLFIFYPRVKRSFVLTEAGGKLTLDKRALEGLVRTKVKTKEFVTEPKVDVQATKNKIKVKVKGQLKRTSSLIGRTGTLMEEIRQELQQVLGSSEKIAIEVKYVDIEKQNQVKRQPRVE
ncbi:alkaline shock response membrane anchor protein AmaP [Enterococcus nangangensis]